jgi:hypothetical protein
MPLQAQHRRAVARLAVLDYHGIQRRVARAEVRAVAAEHARAGEQLERVVGALRHQHGLALGRAARDARLDAAQRREQGARGAIVAEVGDVHERGVIVDDAVAVVVATPTSRARWSRRSAGTRSHCPESVDVDEARLAGDITARARALGQALRQVVLARRRAGLVAGAAVQAIDVAPRASRKSSSI